MSRFSCWVRQVRMKSYMYLWAGVHESHLPAKLLKSKLSLAKGKPISKLPFQRASWNSSVFHAVVFCHNYTTMRFTWRAFSIWADIIECVIYSFFIKFSIWAASSMASLMLSMPVPLGLHVYLCFCLLLVFLYLG